MSNDGIQLEATVRDATGRRANEQVREAGAIPAVVYGEGIEPQSVKVPFLPFTRAYGQAGESQIVHLVVGETTYPVLIKDVAHNPQTDEPIHIDFWHVDVTKPIVAPVALVFSGTSAAVRDEGGTLVRVMNELEVRAVPTVMPKQIEVNIDALATFEDAISVGDLSLPEGAEIIGQEENDTVATVEAPRSEEELEALDEEVSGDVSDVEGVATDAEGEEGEGEESSEGRDDSASEGEEKSDE